MVELAVAFEEMGRALVPGAFLSTVALAGSLIENACSPEYRAMRLQAICEGRSKATVALAGRDRQLGSRCRCNDRESG